MTKRLAAHDWIDFALRTLAQEGFDALKADVLARKLRVSRGSFYWHFKDLSGFHAEVIEHWRQSATEAIIADLESHERREERLDALLRRAFGHRNMLEVRMRAWADNTAAAARAVQDIDRRRRDYIERMLTEAGIPAPLAATRARLLYWAYLGAALSGSNLSGEALDRTVAELKRLGLADAPAAIEARDDPGPARTRRTWERQTVKRRKREGTEGDK